MDKVKIKRVVLSFICYFCCPTNTTTCVLYIWCLLDTTKCFGCPHQPSSGGALLNRKSEMERAVLTNSGVKLLQSNYNIVRKTG
jgi:hypothetical protein